MMTPEALERPNLPGPRVDCSKMVSATVLAVLILACSASIAVYRLYLSPLAKFPGPKLAALTSWYCIYHDLFRKGQYIWVVEEMHRQYGPIVRIMPNVLHVNDPSFVDKLYSQSPSMRRERSSEVLNLFTTHGSVLSTRDHDLHRRRRAVLNRFFSQQNVRRLVPVINETLDDLLGRMKGWAKDGRPVAFNPACKAATKDVIQAYALGDGRRCLHMEDCNAGFFATLSAEAGCHFSVHFHWLSVLLTKLPKAVIVSMSPQVQAFIEFLDGLAVQINRIKNERGRVENPTIFHEILSSDIPDSEKATQRLVDEAMVLTIAGADTTAMTLSALVFHVLYDPAIYAKLSNEINAAFPDATQPLDPTKLDGLKYLNALIEETLRLYPSATHRQNRVAPDDDLLFTYPDGRTLVIPAGTSVGMTASLINRHPSWFDNPETFEPNRYSDGNTPLRRQLTFSKGARQCLGMNLAYQELQIFAAGIFRKYGRFDPTLKQQKRPTLELYETTVEDVRTYADFVTPGLRPGSQGVRLRIREG